jgi:chemotaxis-related protein WspD
MTTAGRINTMADELHIDDCWNRIGVWSKTGAICERLVETVHCRNCEVYSAAGRVLLDRPTPQGARQEWAARYEQPVTASLKKGTSITVFRIGEEWLAIPTLVVKSVSDPVPLRRIPHRRNPVLRGMANLASELELVVSLEALLGIAAGSAPAKSDEPRRGTPIRRLLRVLGESGSFAFEVSEVSGTHRYDESQIGLVPSTLEKVAQRYVRGTVEIASRRAGVLDFELLAYGVAQAMK